MKISINPIVLLRIPAFAITDQLAEVWDVLKLSISQSSASFYEKISAVQAEDLKHLDFKVQFTIWKYFNRSKFRGTPYGSFAGIADCRLTDLEEEVIFSNTQHLHRFKDWSNQNDINASDEELSSTERLYFANSSNYTTSKTIRFLTFQDEVFELSEIERSTFIVSLLELCSAKVNYRTLSRLALERDVSEEVLKGILKAMISMQLIFTDLNPNIIGPDYFKRIHQELLPQEPAYLIAERKVLSGGVNSAVFKHLPSCIDYLIQHTLYSENEYFKHFKEAFKKRFDQEEISLMNALDPELGIGYGGLEESVNSSPLDADRQAGKFRNDSSIQMTAFAHQLLKSLIQGKGDTNQVIRLETYKGTPDEEKKQDLKPANSFSALARIAGDLVVIDHLGGCTANALLGRFTLANEAIESACKTIAAQEAAANPEVIFFDLAYTAERSVDNINRRKSIYEHELPILNYSCAEHPIALNDLLITIKENEVILLSKKYGKRVVPRLATAYNYSRSDLSVYRFLCDLQHQHIQTQLAFDVQQLLPELDFYPRIQYENLVLSTAKWRIRASDLKDTNLKQLLNTLGVSQHFSAGNGDQTLCFNRSDEQDLLYFKHYLNQYNEFVISEVIISDNQVFKCNLRKSYFTQVLLTLNHSEKCYNPHYPAIITEKSSHKKVIVPGKDWLYFELYCHPQKMNFILTQRIAEFIARYEQKFKTWFFIRYNDPEHHLRLRLQLREKTHSEVYISKLMDLLAAELKDGLITDVQLKTYRRETERYGHQQIGLTEQHFGKDSAYAIALLQEEPDEFQLYANCIALMKTTMPVLALSSEESLAFVKGVQQSFESAHEMGIEDFKKVNKSWVSFATAYSAPAIGELHHSFSPDLVGSFKSTLEAASGAQFRMELFCSLFHMHINRLFASHQRTHEMIIYSFFYKVLQREKQQLPVLKFNG